MTDAKSRLRPLDRFETPDVWGRATTLDPRSEMDEVASGHRSSKRSVAGIVAFAVFIAAGAFAWQALRPVTRPETALGPIEGTILWPERTAAMLASAQSLADSGDPSVAWRLDPNEVATRFAEDVLGWGSPGSGYTVSTTQEGAAAATAVVSRLPVHCPATALAQVHVDRRAGATKYLRDLPGWPVGVVVQDDRDALIRRQLPQSRQELRHGLRQFVGAFLQRGRRRVPPP